MPNLRKAVNRYLQLDPHHENIKYMNEFLVKITFYLFHVSILISCASDKDRNEYIGSYQINIIKTDWGQNKDSFRYENLKLLITKNDSFYFSSDVPFIAFTSGRWEIRSSDGIQWAYLQYGNGQYGKIEDQVGITEDGELYINNPRPKQGLQTIPRLVFRRIGD